MPAARQEISLSWYRPRRMHALSVTARISGIERRFQLRTPCWELGLIYQRSMVRVKVTTPAGTQPDSVLRLKRKGLPEFGGKETGRFVLRLNVRVPEKLEQKNANCGSVSGLSQEPKSVDELRSLGRVPGCLKLCLFATRETIQ